MTKASDGEWPVRPTIMPLGDAALLVRFGDTLSDAANSAAIGFARALAADPVPGIVETVPNLISVLLRYDQAVVQLPLLTGELRLRLSTQNPAVTVTAAQQTIAVSFGGEQGPDLETVAAALSLSVEAFIAAHNAAPLRILATGFAPGFVYCGFHSPEMLLPRRTEVRAAVPPGTVLFAAGQTAITATTIPTGWHVIGSTSFRNFEAQSTPPTLLQAGDSVIFEVAS